jgi:hypothetical protein
MAIKQPAIGPMQMPVGAQVTEVTLSPLAICHYITDEELAGISEMQADPVKDIFLWAIGGLVGAIVPAFDGLSHFSNAAHPMTKTDLVSMFIAAATFSVAVVTGILWRRKSSMKQGAVDTIRSRPKVQLVRN